LQTEKNGHQTTDNCPCHSRDQELFCDHLMILAEYVFRDERFFMVMYMVLIVMRFMSSDYLRMSMHCCVVAHDRIFLLIGFFGPDFIC
jgi:hypothetical protein